MATIQKYGLKRHYLNKHRKDVNKFYSKKIGKKIYKSDLIFKYIERFINYEDKLFTFLEHDGVFWHNNPAEHALRQVLLQSDVSRHFFNTMIKEYLILLGIKQSCKFQNKSFLDFLLSSEKDIDRLKRKKSV